MSKETDVCDRCGERVEVLIRLEVDGYDYVCTPCYRVLYG